MKKKKLLKRMKQINANLEQTTTALLDAGAEQDEAIHVMLRTIPDVQILKTQMGGVEERLNNSPFSKAVMNDLIQDVSTLKIQFQNTNRRYNGLIEEVLRQKKFLAKIEALIQQQAARYMVTKPTNNRKRR